MGKHKEKEIKTNAMRILEKNKIPYETIQYECEEFIDGLHTAEKTGAPVEQSFKTLVIQGKSKEYYVLVIPIAEEIDLKKLNLTSDTRRIQDLKGNYLLIFANEWSIRWAEEHNPDLKLAEFGRW